VGVRCTVFLAFRANVAHFLRLPAIRTIENSANQSIGAEIFGV